MASREDAVADARLALREFLAAQRRLRGREAQRHGTLSFSQYAVLRVLVDGDEHPIGELAAAADVSPASATKMIDGLERSGLVARVRDVEDRRRVGVTITDDGRAALAGKDREIQVAWERVLQDAEPDEIAAIATALRHVAAIYERL
ncbi:MAG: MarR family transcriptional regulator [Solirubrobacteraceae bacterium]